MTFNTVVAEYAHYINLDAFLHLFDERYIHHFICDLNLISIFRYTICLLYDVIYYFSLQILGNGLVSLLLNGITSHDDDDEVTNNTILNLTNEDWSHCGAHQCQVQPFV